MFSGYNEIAKLIKDYIEDSLTKPMVNPSILNDKIKETYGVSLSEMDLTNLTNKISSAKATRQDYENGVKNSYRAVTDWSNGLKKAEEITFRKEGEARQLAYTFANKLCIMAYKGPLTLDTMKELKEHGYDGTYGKTTMMQMYALYTEKERLEETNKKQESVILQKQTEVDSYRQQYTLQFQTLQQVSVENQDLKNENSHLKASQRALLDKISKQSEMIQSLVEKVEHLSKRIPIQIMEGIKNFFTKEKTILDPMIQEPIEEEKRMH